MGGPYQTKDGTIGIVGAFRPEPAPRPLRRVRDRGSVRPPTRGSGRASPTTSRTPRSWRRSSPRTSRRRPPPSGWSAWRPSTSCAPGCCPLKEALEDPQVRHNGMVIEMDHPQGKIKVVGNAHQAGRNAGDRAPRAAAPRPAQRRDPGVSRLQGRRDRQAPVGQRHPLDEGKRDELNGRRGRRSTSPTARTCARATCGRSRRLPRRSAWRGCRGTSSSSGSAAARTTALDRTRSRRGARRASLWGVLFRMSEADLQALVRLEDGRYGYVPTPKAVYLRGSGEPVTALVFMVRASRTSTRTFARSTGISGGCWRGRGSTICRPSTSPGGSWGSHGYAIRTTSGEPRASASAAKRTPPGLARSPGEPTGRQPGRPGPRRATWLASIRSARPRSASRRRWPWAPATTAAAC